MLAILFFVSIPFIEATENSTLKYCDGFQADFDVNSVVGTWSVAAVVLDKNHDDIDVSCHDLDITEADESAIRSFINNTAGPERANYTFYAGDKLIRQQGYAGIKAHVWSKTVGGVSGCFEEVLCLIWDISEGSVQRKFVFESTRMQLHLFESDGKTLLLQLLWGKMISAVVYCKPAVRVTRTQLMPAFKLLEALRGPQVAPKFCRLNVIT